MRTTGRRVPATSRYLACSQLTLGFHAANMPLGFGRHARALAERAHSMVFLRVDPQLARLRSDSRFARLLRQVFPE